MSNEEESEQEPEDSARGFGAASDGSEYEISESTSVRPAVIERGGALALLAERHRSKSLRGSCTGRRMPPNEGRLFVLERHELRARLVKSLPSMSSFAIPGNPNHSQVVVPVWQENRIVPTLCDMRTGNLVPLALSEESSTWSWRPDGDALAVCADWAYRLRGVTIYSRDGSQMSHIDIPWKLGGSVSLEWVTDNALFLRACDSGLLVVDPEREEVQTLLVPEDEQTFSHIATWANRGILLDSYFSRLPENRESRPLIPDFWDHRLELVSLVGERRTISNNRTENFASSPDGRRIAFADYGSADGKEPEGLVVLDLDDGSRLRLGDRPHGCVVGSVAWTSNEEVIWVAQKPNTHELWSYSIGGEPVCECDLDLLLGIPPGVFRGQALPRLDPNSQSAPELDD